MVKPDRRRFLLGAAAGLFAPEGRRRAWAQESEEATYALALPAYIYGFPFVHSAAIRWRWLSQPEHSDSSPSAPFNQFWHQSRWSAGDLPGGGNGCLDRLLSLAFLDLGSEPIILSVPESGGRYYALRLCGADCDTFAYVGSRSTGAASGHYAVLGPDWRGTLPKSVTALAPSHTRQALIIGQTFVGGPKDLTGARKLQTHLDLTPLSLWAKLDETYPPDRDTWMPYSGPDELADWKTMQRAMRENPFGRASGIVRWLDSLGLDPTGANVAPTTARALARAAADARQQIAMTAQSGGARVNTWLYPPRTIGRAGLAGDFLIRAGTQCQADTLADTAEEMTCLWTSTDGSGMRLTGGNGYNLRFGPQALPPAFLWSLTLYDARGGLDPTKRCHLTSKQEDLNRGSDGSLSIAIGQAPAPRDKTSSWLEAPEGEFELRLRLYSPGAPVIDQSWSPPALVVKGKPDRAPKKPG